MEGNAGMGFLVVGLIVLVLIIAAKSTAKEFKNRYRKTFINSSIADLIEDGSILPLAGTDENGQEEYSVVRGTQAPRDQVAERILFYGMGTSQQVTAKEFHAGIYDNKDKIHEFITKAGIVIPAKLPTPKERMESGNESLAALLPLLILGDVEGYSTSDSSPVYIGDSDYSGHSDNGGDGGDSGGDSGGGDGGGGGGD